MISTCTVTSLKTEYLHNPLGIDALNPRLSWVIDSTRRGCRQTSYRIIVASNDHDLEVNRGDLWDSGKVNSSESVHVQYRGIELQSGQECFWKVRVWDETDQATEWSESGQWSMGLLHRGDWIGKWIGISSKREDVGRPCSYYRRQVEIAKPIRRAVIYATALGVYEISVNGIRVGEDYFTPEWTDYNLRVLYQTYDVTSLLHGGGNAVGGILGDGWYAGNIGWYGPDQYGIFPRFYMQIHIEYVDGSTEVIATDDTWKASLGPILYSDFQMGERYDAHLEQTGWNQPGFDDSLWKSLEVFFDYQGWFTAQCSPRIRVTETREPISLTETVPGTMIADMGQNMVGWAQISLTSNRETEVRLRYGEMLNQDGTLYTENLRDAKQTDTYIFSEAKKVTYEPKFTFHGFRFVEITYIPGEVEIDKLLGKVVHNDMPKKGNIVTSSSMINQLVSNIVWTQRGNFISVPTDCPQRDERLGWTGDAQVFARTATYNMDVSGFFTKFTGDIVDAQRKTGAFTDTAPFVKGTPNWAPMIASAGWADAGVIIPWTLYQVYGDVQIIERHFGAMAGWVDYLDTLNPAHLRKDTQFYGDWLSLQADMPLDLFATAYFAYSAKLVSEMAVVIGRTDDALVYRQMFEDIKEQFNKAFVGDDGKIAGETQSSYAMALFMDLLLPDKRAIAAKHLVNDIENRGWHISTGIHGIKYLLPVLCESGYIDVAYRLLLQDTYPSWGYSIKHGATTIWERWDGWTEENGFQTWRMNSFNHYALGAVGEWLYRYSGGIDLLAGVPGYKGIKIKPYIGEGLTFVECDYESMYGRISSHWKLVDEGLEMLVRIPSNTYAIVHIPVKDQAQVYESGIPVLQSNDIILVDKLDREWIVRVGSGDYLFQSRLEV